MHSRDRPHRSLRLHPLPRSSQEILLIFNIGLTAHRDSAIAMPPSAQRYQLSDSESHVRPLLAKFPDQSALAPKARPPLPPLVGRNATTGFVNPTPSSIPVGAPESARRRKCTTASRILVSAPRSWAATHFPTASRPPTATWGYVADAGRSREAHDGAVRRARRATAHRLQRRKLRR